MMYFIGVTAFAAGIAFGIAATLIYWPWMEHKACAGEE
jgi:hypothetical protein